jgi:hypothetical protein
MRSLALPSVCSAMSQIGSATMRASAAGASRGQSSTAGR